MEIQGTPATEIEAGTSKKFAIGKGWKTLLVTAEEGHTIKFRISGLSTNLIGTDGKKVVGEHSTDYGTYNEFVNEEIEITNLGGAEGKGPSESITVTINDKKK